MNFQHEGLCNLFSVSYFGEEEKDDHLLMLVGSVIALSSAFA